MSGVRLLIEYAKEAGVNNLGGYVYSMLQTFGTEGREPSGPLQEAILRGDRRAMRTNLGLRQGYALEEQAAAMKEAELQPPPAELNPAVNGLKKAWRTPWKVMTRRRIRRPPTQDSAAWEPSEGA